MAALLSPRLVLALVLLALPGASLADVFSAAQEQQVRDIVQAAMDCFNTTGLTVAVVKGNQSWTRGFGLADVERGVNVTSSTLFGIGSLTKAFTSVLLAMALNGSKYTWQTPLREILGEEFHLATEQLTRETTLRDILSHRTGLTPANLPLFAGTYSGLPRETVFKNLRYLETRLKFRDEYLYNNWMYGLAGHVTSRLLGQDWEEALRTRLLEPLGMRSSRVLGLTVETSDDVMAKPYYLHEDHLHLIDPSVFRIHPQEPAGAIATSAEDMVHWMRFLLGEGKSEGGQSLVEASLLQDCFRSVIPVNDKTEQWEPKAPITFVNMGYGLAWFKAVYRGRRLIHHSGGLQSYVSELFLFPDLDLGVFASQSGAYPRVLSRPLVLVLADLLLGEAPLLNHSSACDKQVTRDRNDSNTDVMILDDVISGSLAPYLGVYRHGLLGNVSVVANAGRDGLELEYGHLTGRLNRTSQADSFRLFFTGSMFFLGIGPDLNVSVSFPVRFLNLSSGHYQALNLTDSLTPDSHVFSRGAAQPTSNSGSALAVCTTAILALVTSLFLVELSPTAVFSS